MEVGSTQHSEIEFQTNRLVAFEAFLDYLETIKHPNGKDVVDLGVDLVIAPNGDISIDSEGQEYRLDGNNRFGQSKSWNVPKSLAPVRLFNEMYLAAMSELIEAIELNFGKDSFLGLKIDFNRIVKPTEVVSYDSTPHLDDVTISTTRPIKQLFYYHRTEPGSYYEGDFIWNEVYTGGYAKQLGITPDHREKLKPIPTQCLVGTNAATFVHSGPLSRALTGWQIRGFIEEISLSKFQNRTLPIDF